MKNLSKWWSVAGIAIATLIYLSACKELSNEEIAPQNENAFNPGSTLSLNSTTSTLDTPRTGTSPYLVNLVSVTNNGDGSYSWTWTAKNPSPTSVLGGTIPDLNYLDINLGACASSSDVISSSTSPDGDRWTTTFNPTYRPDFGQTCYSEPVIKFDLGTRDTLLSYYRLTLNKNFNIDSSSVAVYQSTARTDGCGVFELSGVGCLIPEPAGSCSFNVKYHFSKQNLTWSSVNVAGSTYTQAEAKAIYNAPNKKGTVSDSKKGFLQVGAIRLSGTNVSPTATVWADVAIVENYLITLGKLSPSNLPSGNAAASAAADRISTWIEAHNCQRR